MHRTITQLDAGIGDHGTKLEEAMHKLTADGQQLDECRCFVHRVGLMTRAGFDALAEIVSRPGVPFDLVVRGLGNGRLSEKYALAIPEALQRILDQTPDSLGLFKPISKNRGPYATSWIRDLCNQGNGVADGCAYEVLATARLMKIPSSCLVIGKMDRLDFGYKLQASYPSAGTTIPQPRRRTVEADVIIYRQDPDFEVQEIGVDFKHSLRGVQRVSPVQIDGVIVALSSGELDEFHFVSNCRFQPRTHSHVEAANEHLRSLGVAQIGMHENYAWS